MLTNTFKTFFIRKLSLKHLRLLSTNAEQAEHDVIPVNQSQEKLVKLAVIGLPNAGKSTFINNLMDRKVSF